MTGRHRPGRDELRSAALLLGAGADPALLREAAASPALRSRRVPPLAGRIRQRMAMRHGHLGYLADCAEPMAVTRRMVLGDDADGPPRVIVRVDEFPTAGAYAGPGTVEDLAVFHEILRVAGVPYLMAVTPRVARDYLDPAGRESRDLRDDEIDALRRIADGGTTMALHGLDHRTVDPRPRHHSELTGRAAADLDLLLERGQAILRDLGIETPVFVPPFNRFDAEQYDVLARRFEVVCGGPESVMLLGFHGTPLWRGDAVYLPSYVPLYGRASVVQRGVADLVARRAAVWAPVTLHLSWEAEDGWDPLRRLADAIAPFSASWDEFIAAARAARETTER
ncbi:MAG: DUF2334 domain-containing protein [Thermoleophilia bacterium]